MQQKEKSINGDDFTKYVQDEIFYKTFSRNFMGQEISWRMNIFSGEMQIEVNDSFANVFGFESLEKMMLDDGVLDFANQIEQQTGEFPFRQIRSEEEDLFGNVHQNIEPFCPPF